MKTIAIVNINPDTFTNPTLVELISQLGASGNKVLLFCREDHDPVPERFSFVRLFAIPPYYGRLSWRPSVIRETKGAYHKAEEILAEEKVVSLLGVDPIGFLIAARLKRPAGCKLGNLSFEIFFKNELESQRNEKFLTIHRLHKKKCHGDVDFLVIQDDIREQDFFKENGIGADRFKRIFRVPVAPMRSDLPKAENLHKRLGIPEDRKIICHSGHVSEWTGISRILDALENDWDDHFWLLIHARNPLDPQNTLRIRMEDLQKKGRPITLHTHVFPDYRAYEAFLSGADAGLAMYIPDFVGGPHAGRNIGNIGLASGKFSTYMKLGLPTITTDGGVYPSLNQTYHFGAVWPDGAPFRPCLTQLKEGLPDMKHGAEKLYAEVLDPETRLKEMIDYLCAS